jgi:hypothetical protein
MPFPTLSTRRRIPTGCLPTRRRQSGCGCRSGQRSLSTALHRMGANCRIPEVPITRVQLETLTTEPKSDRLSGWPSIPSIAYNDHCFHGSPLVDVTPIKVRREPRDNIWMRTWESKHHGLAIFLAWEVLATTWPGAQSRAQALARRRRDFPMPYPDSYRMLLVLTGLIDSTSIQRQRHLG